MKKKLLATLLTCALAVTTLAGCGEKPVASASNATPKAETKASAEKKEEAPKEELTGIDLIISQAEAMTMEELAKKAIEESNGKTFYGVGNSSRGKSALPKFIYYLKTIDANYNM